MEFNTDRESKNVEDRRGMKPAVVGGGIGVTIVAMIIAYFLNVNPQQVKNVINGAQQMGGRGQAKGEPRDPNDPFAKFSRKLISSMEVVWGDVFKSAGEVYQEPKMVIFEDAVSTQGCGNAPSAVGPFYCPADKTLYLDPVFFDELEKKLGGSAAEFSKSYVVAHEVGHHVQNLLGYSAKVDEKRGTPLEKQYSVRLELQADYLAGVWAHHATKKGLFKIDLNDVESALKTAKAIGDDALQKRSQGWSSPESYTHGTSAQRYKYFKLGLQTGDLKALKTFFEVRYEEL